MALERLKTVDEVIDALGGTAKVAAMVDRSPQAVSNWRADNRIARHFFVLMSAALEQIGFTADPALWGMSVRKKAA